MPLSRYFQLCLDFAKRWSKEYANNDKILVASPTIELKDWTAGYQWAKSNKIITSKILENNVVYYCPTGKENKVAEEQKELEMRWNIFDQFKKKIFCCLDY